MKKSTLLIVLAFVLAAGLVFMASGGQQAIADNPGAGSGSPLVIAARQGATQVQVPNLIGKTKGEAKKELSKVGLKMGRVSYTRIGKGPPETVVKQKPKAKKKVAEGSAVDLWVLKGAAKISPKIVQKGKKVYMEFPETVNDVTISDAQGKKLQQFKKGKRFDVTESVIKTKAGLIKVAWEPSLPDKLYPLSGGTAVDTNTVNVDFSQFIHENLVRNKALAMVKKPEIQPLYIDDTFIEQCEPDNNEGFYQLPGPKLYSGSVGAPGDPVDRLAFTSGPSPEGTVISVHVVSGDVNVTLYWGVFLDLVPYVENGSDFWIAVAPSGYIYFNVQPTVTGVVSPYTISVYHKYILNPNEALQTEANPMELYLGGAAKEGALIPRTGDVDYEDWFMVQAPQNPSRLRIIVTDAGMATANTLRISLGCTHPSCAGVEFEHSIGTNNEATLETWQAYGPGMWKIRVALGWPGPMYYGTGSIPSGYRKPYKIRVEAIP